MPKTLKEIKNNYKYEDKKIILSPKNQKSVPHQPNVGHQNQISHKGKMI